MTAPNQAWSLPSLMPEPSAPGTSDLALRPVPGMQPAPFILICDHRGEGAQAVAPKLTAQGFRVEVSVHLRGTLEQLMNSEPDLILLDPLSSGASVELDAIDRARRGDSLTPVLVIADGDRPLPAIMSPPLCRTRAVGPRTPLGSSRGVPAAHRTPAAPGRAASRGGRPAPPRPARRQHRPAPPAELPDAPEGALLGPPQRHKLNLALLLIDLDKFGQVNKQHDHTVGDSLIKKVADVIRTQKRTEDVAGRLGGDEFAVLLPHTAKVDAATVVQRLVERIKDLSGPFPGSHGGIATSASIGFETFNGDDIDSLETLRNHAERALRSAKRSGGNRGVYYRSLEE